MQDVGPINLSNQAVSHVGYGQIKKKKKSPPLSHARWPDARWRSGSSVRGPSLSRLLRPVAAHCTPIWRCPHPSRWLASHATMSPPILDVAWQRAVRSQPQAAGSSSNSGACHPAGSRRTPAPSRPSLNSGVRRLVGPSQIPSAESLARSDLVGK
ncbi:hypothetical protein BDA96_03G188700 [Sorghum bicolor]|uniref:Uncharacterized protein n=2 Tax=Sorghum bicolor TaxID=4558 RepID=A0A921RDL5_SORBI|nr:hypothetical protein BDA96_03G188700 [Sorghum bicolor]KAG0537904.1 hypothetical protein BDA96_03G188700 [Sorghum bicolor]KAG0537905.1 hypothetical protein BDA96_03G188700 [Sorghum bicolor]KXG32611.1 hypothetical protein SORBI_3003G174800 [Sorghum bicolor]KXG32612.1 hypothetical protein SORBI_3003G174800 [Sorghum bicolor]